MRATLLCAALCLLSSSAASATALGSSKILSLRGGGVAPTLAPPVSPQEAEAPPAAVQLKVAQCAPPADGIGRVELPKDAFASLGLSVGDRVRVRKMKKAAFWSSVADQTLASAVEDTELATGSVRVLTKDVAELRLKAGEDVLVAPIPAPAMRADGPAATAVPSETDGAVQPAPRRNNSFLRNYLWYRMMFGGPRYYGGYGGHYGGYGGKRTYRRSYSRMGGRRRR